MSGRNKEAKLKNSKIKQSKSTFKCDAFTKFNVEKKVNRASRNTDSSSSEEPSNLKCAPGKGVGFSDGSCFTTQVVIELVRAFNKAHPNDAIREKTWPTEAEYRKDLLGKLGKKLERPCGNDERCWLTQDFIKYMKPEYQQEALQDTHRPHGPGGQFKWLGTTNIAEVMEQYESVYDDFYFLGAVPADFDELNDAGARKVKYMGFPEEYIESLITDGNKKRFGMIFNTDGWRKSGQHWISAYADLNTGIVAFFDSVANAPDPRTRILLKRFEDVFKRHGVTAQYKENHTKFQYKDSECGVYSINFILRMVDGGDFDYIVANPIDDTTVNACRVVYFGNQL